MTESLWDTFWRVSSIRGTTINFIDTPVIGKTSFLVPLYVLLVLAVASIFISRRLVQTEVKRHGAAKALLAAFVAAALLFSLRMDYGWYKIWQLDRKGGSLDSAIAADMQSVYNFAGNFKKNIPLTEKVRILTDDPYDRMVLKYDLLPIKVSTDANYIVVFSDNHVVFDTGRNMLREDENVVEKNVSLIASYEGKFFVFKKEKDTSKTRTEPKGRKKD